VKLVDIGSGFIEVTPPGSPVPSEKITKFVGAAYSSQNI
jgi:hypothetical protein